MWWKVLFFIAVVLAAVLVTARFYGKTKWEAQTRKLHQQLEATEAPIQQRIFDQRELESLPEPVQRYFLAALKDGQPLVKAVTIEHSGTFNMSETGEQWKPFTSIQQVKTHRPGFIWNGRITMLPGLTVDVHDAYVAGEGILHAALFGLVTVADMRGTPEMAQGELMRFLAEATWYPTALLAGPGVQWEALNDSSAKAMLSDGETSVELLFVFNEEGLIDQVYADSRYRSVAGKLVATPWSGRFWNYEVRNGMRVPLDGEVTWILPEGPKPYWRGRITAITHQFAGGDEW